MVTVAVVSRVPAKVMVAPEMAFVMVLLVLDLLAPPLML